MESDCDRVVWGPQSPVSRLCSLAATSDPSSLRSTSFKPTEPMTDAREPEQAGTWLSSTGSHKHKKRNHDGEQQSVQTV